MIIAGAGGFARQLHEVFIQLAYSKALVFFDNVSPVVPSELYGHPVLRAESEIRAFIRQDPCFCLGLGGCLNRRRIYDLFLSWGALPEGVISPEAHIARNLQSMGQGVTVLTGALLENEVSIGNGVLINNRAMVHHQSVVGDFCDLAPGATLLGKVTLEEEVFIGAHAVVLPGLHIGRGACVGAGAVVTRDVPAGQTVVGNPAKPIRS